MKKKWSASHRIWHWVNAVVIFALILTGIFIMTDDNLEELFKAPHIILGFILCVLIPFRAIRARFFGDNRTLTDAKKYRGEAIKIILAKGFPRTRDEFHIFHKAGVKNSYLALYALLAGIALTGLGMVILFRMELAPEIRYTLKEIHEVLFFLITAFIPLHIGGVVFAEITDEPNITSDMIHGGNP
jgi:Ni/Fe-hydrogenase 1 B-type cytochrome subunit